MSIFCLFPGFFSLSPGSNLPNPMSWRAVPWLWLGDTVLKHIKALHLGTLRPQDVHFPVQGTRGVGSCPCPTSHFPTLSTQDLGYGAAHWEFGIWTSSVGIWDTDQLSGNLGYGAAQWEFGIWTSSHFTPICALGSEWESGKRTRTCFAALPRCPKSRVHVKPWPSRLSPGLQGAGKAARIFLFWKHLHLTKGHAIYWDFNAL